MTSATSACDRSQGGWGRDFATKSLRAKKNNHLAGVALGQAKGIARQVLSEIDDRVHEGALAARPLARAARVVGVTPAARSLALAVARHVKVAQEVGPALFAHLLEAVAMQLGDLDGEAGNERRRECRTGSARKEGERTKTLAS